MRVKSPIAILLSIFILICTVRANDVSINGIVTTVQSVTVFRNGAQVTRSAHMEISPGNQKYIFYGVPHDIDQRTIYVKFPSNIKVTSVFTQNNNDESQKDELALNLENKISNVRKEIRYTEILLNTYKDEETLILTNKNMSGSESGVSSESLAKMADLYRTRLLFVRKQIYELTYKTDSLNSEIFNTQKTLHVHRPQRNDQQLVTEVYSTQKQKIEVIISYLDPRASWRSNYSFRLNQIDQPVLLENNAAVYQNTGENWKDIQLVLATGDPNRSFIAPVVTPWFLQYLDQIFPLGGVNSRNGGEISVRGSRSNETVYFLDGVRQTGNMIPQSEVDLHSKQRELPIKDQSNMRAAQNYNPNIQENVTFSQYKIPHEVTIDHENKSNELKIKTDTLNSILHYYCVPSINNKVFLKAGIPNWENYNLTSGDVKIYFENTYSGISYLDVSSAEDTLHFSLGQDIAILCESKKIKTFKKSLAFSGKKEITEAKEYTIKNNKSYEIDVEVQERIPLSTDKDMEVKLLDSSDGNFDKDTGIITWKVKLKPAEKTTKTWSYSITIPKSKNIQL